MRFLRKLGFCDVRRNDDGAMTAIGVLIVKMVPLQDVSGNSEFDNRISRDAYFID